MDYKSLKKKMEFSRKEKEAFTEEFFNLFLTERQRVIQSIITGNPVNNPYFPVFETDFYQNYGSAYCQFLEVFTSELPEYRLFFYDNLETWGFSGFKQSITSHFENINIAKAYGEAIKNDFGANYVEVIRVSTN